MMVRRHDKVHDRIPDVAHYLRTVTHESIHKTIDETLALVRTSLVNEPEQRGEATSDKPKIVVKKTEARTSLYEELERSGGQKSLKPSTRHLSTRPSRKKAETAEVCEFLKSLMISGLRKPKQPKQHDKSKDPKPGCSRDRQ